MGSYEAVELLHWLTSESNMPLHAHSWRPRRRRLSDTGGLREPNTWGVSPRKFQNQGESPMHGSVSNLPLERLQSAGDSRKEWVLEIGVNPVILYHGSDSRATAGHN